MECEYYKSNQRTFSCQYISGCKQIFNLDIITTYLDTSFFHFCQLFFFFSRNFKFIHRLSILAIMTNAVQHTFTSSIWYIFWGHFLSYIYQHHFKCVGMYLWVLPNRSYFSETFSSNTEEILKSLNSVIIL